MSVYHPASTLKNRFQLVLSSFLQREGLTFSDILSEERIAKVFDDADVSFAQDEENPVSTPAVTLWEFLSQVLFKAEQRSCLATVSRGAVFLVALGQKACSKNTGAYCRARAKIPTAVIRQLATEAAVTTEKNLPEELLWKGRRVKLADGFTVSMPDTVKNQEAYPRPATQKPGAGFPLARCVALFSLATARALDLEIGPYLRSEKHSCSLDWSIHFRVGRVFYEAHRGGSRGGPRKTRPTLLNPVENRDAAVRERYRLPMIRGKTTPVRSRLGVDSPSST